MTQVCTIMTTSVSLLRKQPLDNGYQGLRSHCAALDLLVGAVRYADGLGCLLLGHLFVTAPCS